MENQTTNPKTAQEIQDWLVAYLAEALEIKPDEINVSQNFQDYGLDSSAAVGLTGDLGDWLGQDLDPTLLLDYTTIATIAEHLGETETTEEIVL